MTCNFFNTIRDSASECRDTDLSHIGCMEISVFCKTYGMRIANKISAKIYKVDPFPRYLFKQILTLNHDQESCFQG